jgi:type II secretory pathway pseudopilin PulG
MLNSRLQRGFYLLEAIVVMSVAITLMGLGSRYITDSAERSVNQVAAQQLQQVSRAAQQYVQDHYQAFNENSNHPLEWQTLVDQGYLSDKVLKLNHYGQAYQFQVNNINGQLQLLLTTLDGQSISESSMRQIAQIAGSSSGYASTLHKNKIVGLQEGWFVEGVPLEIGHLASLSMINEKEIMDAAAFLRRTKFKGHEEYNRMETDLLMGENTIRLVKNSTDVEINTGGIVFSDAKGKNIGIYNTKFYPHIEIHDSTLQDASNKMTLNSADLKFNKGNNDIHIGVDQPEISLNNQTKATSTKITPGLIDVVDGGGSFSVSGNKLRSSTDKSGEVGNHSIFDAKGLYSEVTNNYIKIPFIEITRASAVNAFYTSWGLETKICGSKAREGALFLMGQQGYGHRQLLICADGHAREISWWE